MTKPATFNNTWSCATCLFVYRLGDGREGDPLNKPAVDRFEKDEMHYQCVTCHTRAQKDRIDSFPFRRQRAFWAWLAKELGDEEVEEADRK